MEEVRETIGVAPKGREGYLFLARGLLHESAPLDEVQGLAEKGLGLAQAPDVKALGWVLMADVFSRRHQPDKVNEALRNARMQVPAGGGGAPDVAPRDRTGPLLPGGSRGGTQPRPACPLTPG